ncbi:MAG: HAMP domain-containing histidine kinase, partial [Clostridiaceae bacterium]|nr:HAMP domain-containing histidine kinase [Clostridiaceae bacterium]
MRMMLFRNREFRLLSIILFAMWTTTILFYMFGAFWWWQDISVKLIERDTIVMGRLIESYPELKPEIIEAFTAGPSQKALDFGKNILKDYNYTPENARDILYLPDSPYVFPAVVIPLILTIIFILLFISVFLIFRQLYCHLRNFSEGIEKIMRGDYAVRFSDEKEGEISILGFQINQMAVRIKLLFEKLEDEKQFFKNMMANISHQIKTPLASIGMFNEILEEDGDKEEIRKEFLIRNRKLVERIDWLVQTLLKYARLRTGGLILDREIVKLDTVITHVTENLEPLWRSKGQTVAVSSAASVAAFIDFSWFCEALGNIIKNAIDYTPEGGCIKLIISEGSTAIHISVEDSVQGISPEEKGDIFMPFYRGKSSSKSGTGLGLSLAKLIVEMHNGYIRLFGIPDKGTT